MIKDAHKELSEKLHRKFINISQLWEKTGGSLAEFQQALKEMAAEGTATLAHGDWSLSSSAERLAGICLDRDGGQPVTSEEAETGFMSPVRIIHLLVKIK